MFIIRRRSNSTIATDETFAKREDAKPLRDKMNNHYHKIVPLHNREFYVARSSNHHRGPSNSKVQHCSPKTRRLSKR